MDSNILRQHQQQQQQQQMNSGLMRYRSAPSSLITNFMEGDGESEGCDDFIPSHHGSSSPEAESMFARFMSRSGGDSGSSDLRDIGEKSPAINNRNPQFMGSMEHKSEQNGYSQAPQLIYQTPPPLSNHSSNATDSAYRAVNSMGTGSCSNLIRHSSSPAGLFSHLTVENGYAVMRGIGNFRAGHGTNGEASASTSSRLNSQINFSPGPPSSSGIMSQISEIVSESIGPSSVDDGSLGNSNGGNRYIPSFPISPWDHSTLENYAGLKIARDSNGKIISGLNSSEAQNGDAGNHTPGLAHHFSLPKTSAEMAAILQSQDSVPCKIRAKRGCATHPRSIAERVRRTRISERMRKLQELVSNMDKQTNTSDMLDIAVEYIKDLQKQVKTLNDNLANCTCSSKQKPYSKPSM